MECAGVYVSHDAEKGEGGFRRALIPHLCCCRDCLILCYISMFCVVLIAQVFARCYMSFARLGRFLALIASINFVN